MARSRYIRSEFEVVTPQRAAAEERVGKVAPYAIAAGALMLIATTAFGVNAVYEFIGWSASKNISQTVDTSQPRLR